MPASYGFHPEALLEYEGAASYYLREASEHVASVFVATIESSIAAINSQPTRWRMDRELEIRRCVLRRFPYVICFRWDRLQKHVTIHAVMHGSRHPEYWHRRMEES